MSTPAAVEATLEASFEGLEFGLVAERLEQGLGVWHTNTSGKRLAMAAAASLRVDGRVVAPRAAGPVELGLDVDDAPGQVVHFERMVAVARADAPTANRSSRHRPTLRRPKALGWAGILGGHEAELGASLA